jgi:hypothetical protein
MARRLQGPAERGTEEGVSNLTGRHLGYLAYLQIWQTRLNCAFDTLEDMYGEEVPLVESDRRKIIKLEQENEILYRQLEWARAERDMAQQAASACCRKKDSLELPLTRIKWIVDGKVVPEEGAIERIREIVQEAL